MLNEVKIVVEEADSTIQTAYKNLSKYEFSKETLIELIYSK